MKEAIDDTPSLPYVRSMRLVHKGDFDRAFRQGSRARGAIVLVVARPNGLEVTRLGLSVGKSIWKSAVKRNRIRRIFRESFRTSYPELPRGMDFVLIPAAPKLVPEFEATRAEFVRMAHKATRRCAERAAENAAMPPTDAGRAEASNDKRKSSHVPRAEQVSKPRRSTQPARAESSPAESFGADRAREESRRDKSPRSDSPRSRGSTSPNTTAKTPRGPSSAAELSPETSSPEKLSPDKLSPERPSPEESP